MTEEYRIVKLEAENYMRLSAVEITPTGNLVELTGKNEAGKSSVLNAILAAVNGADSIPDEPIRKGQKEARIRLDLGEIIVSRKLRKRADGSTDIGSVTVEAANGARFTRPQQMLDGMLGKLTLDPIAFANDKPAGQFETLKQFVPGIDFAAVEGKNAADYDKRTEVNRVAKQARAAAEQIAVPGDTPADPVDEAALVAALASAGEHNASIETRKANRTAAAEKIAENVKRATALRGQIAGRQAEIEKRRDERLTQIQAEIERLKAEVVTVTRQATDDCAAAGKTLIAEADVLDKDAVALQVKLDTAGELPTPVDTVDLQAKIAAAKQTNTTIEARKRRDALVKQAEAAEKQSADLTSAMEAREAAKEKAIAESKLPVPGIGFGKDKKGDPIVTLNGLPFKQASEAVRLRTSIAVAMAMNPKLKVILVPSGNGLDADAMQVVVEMADASKCQVWIETVRSDDRIAFVIEDGRLRDAPAVEPQEAA